MSLTSAHRGYEYQDLLVAYSFVDMLLGDVLSVYVDKKLVADDRFDDLTTVNVMGSRKRIQFKHTDENARPLALKTFTTESRSLRLDKLIETMLADRNGPGSNAHTLSFRVVLRDQEPQEQKLTKVLKRLNPSPPPFLAGFNTVRFGFDAKELWNQRHQGKAHRPRDKPFAFLFKNNASLSYQELEWVCEHLVIEVGAPPSSADLTAPDIADNLLLTRVRKDVGAESFPNTNRSSVDVAEALISAARAARQDRLNPTVKELLRRTQLRSDFGAVARAYPVDSVIEVSRPTAVRRLAEEAYELTHNGGHLIVSGPPGHGKSWVSQQLLNKLSEEGWLIAEHYCYLGDADSEQTERVLAEAVFGSLVGRLAEADPRIIEGHRPRFAADESALAACLQQSLHYEPNRKVALVVDGIDHVSRVRALHGVRFDPSRSLAESFASVILPPGVVLIVLSQPGSHLAPIEQVGAKTVPIPGLDNNEIRSLAMRLNVIPDDDNQVVGKARPLVETTECIDPFLDALAERAKGNALYATYLCREMLRLADTHTDFAAAVLNLPPFDGSLKSYYEHLYEALGSTADWVAQIIALVDFAVTRVELREIKPDRARYVDQAISVLQPVLVEKATQGGVRVYHESFSRYLRDRDDPIAIQDLLNSISNWLEGRGFFQDSRAFRSLLTVLSQAAKDERVLNLVDPSFVINAVASGFPASRIISNLAIAIRSAARLGNWPVIVQYVEMSRAVHAYQRERFDSTLVSFADVPASLLGADTLASRLIDDDRLVMQAREGIQMCAAVDELGATAPWHPYMIGYLREEETDNTSYGEESDRAVALAFLRGRLRLTANNSSNKLEKTAISGEIEERGSSDNQDRGSGRTRNLAAPINWNHLGEWVESTDLPINQIIDIIKDTHDWNGVICFFKELEEPGSACLAIAEKLSSEAVLDSDIGSPKLWAIASTVHGIPIGSMHRIWKFDVTPTDLLDKPISDYRDQLLNLTRRVQERSVRWEDGCINDWLDACSFAAQVDPIGLNTSEAIIGDEGWYRCWLRFVIGLSRADAAEPSLKGVLALESLKLLKGDLNPFSGDPRACDLYSLQALIKATISRAMSMLNDEQWSQGLNILKEVSISITTTISGEMGGPVPADFLLQIAVDGTSPSRHSIAEAFLQNEIEDGSAGRFYADLAEYRLLSARLALNADDQAQAKNLWQDACKFLTAYGWRKDSTIYEVLEPLEILIKLDPARARIRVSAAQGLSKRVPLHTDGKGTSHAWNYWWQLLAKADPVAAINLSVPIMLTNCNSPNLLFNGTLKSVWYEWYQKIDPFLSGTLQLTLNMPQRSIDTEEFIYLIKKSKLDNPTTRQLMTWLIARLDERPGSYSATNKTELIAQDDNDVKRINEIVAMFDLPIAVALRNSMPATSKHQWKDKNPSRPINTNELINVGFPPGLPGLVRATRAWRLRPYDSASPKWSVDRFANIIGYRLFELATANRYEEAMSALRTLAEEAGFRKQLSLLQIIAEGLEYRKEFQLAAVAYTLTWTSTRGGGGYVIFGGDTKIGTLHRATALDSDIACKLVAEEIEREIATSRYESYGISRAVIYALAVGALSCSDNSSLNLAFATWDAAFAAIEARTPCVDPSDAPDVVYCPPESDSGDPAPGNLETAIALAVLGGLAHPSREKKRRTFLAIQLLLKERPDVIASALNIAMETISDSATLTWLLRVLEVFNERSLPTLMSCQTSLHNLISRDRLTVRAIARRLLNGERPPLTPPNSPHDALLSESQEQIWLPDNVFDDTQDKQTDLDKLLDTAAGTRLKQGEELLPCLRQAVYVHALQLRDTEAFSKRLESQLNKLADYSRKPWPDAFLAHEEIVEDSLQFIAAGGRAARFMAGELITNPVEWENRLAEVLLDDPTIPIALEACRQPRPPIAPPPSHGDKLWEQICANLRGAYSSIVKAIEEDNAILATITIKPGVTAPIFNSGKFDGWLWLATMEKRFVKCRDWERRNILLTSRYCAVEVRLENDQQALNYPPVTSGNLRMWCVKIDCASEHPSFNKSQPLVGVDYDLTVAGDGRRGLGVPTPILTPTVSLLSLLNLNPGEPFSYEDERGPALALVTWRTEYDTSEHYLAWPRTHGCGIVIRPDLFTQLITTIGEQHLVLRDFVMGDPDFLATEASSS